MGVGVWCGSQCLALVRPRAWSAFKRGLPCLSVFLLTPIHSPARKPHFTHVCVSVSRRQLGKHAHHHHPLTPLPPSLPLYPPNHPSPRVRPPQVREGRSSALGLRTCLTVNEASKTVTLKQASGPKVFTFDHSVAADASQESVFHLAGKPATRACIQGYNGTVFCYGQTGRWV